MRPLLAGVVLALGLPGPDAAGQTAPEEISFEGVDVAFLGEVHDNPEHHSNQAAWVARLQPAALVFEMLPPDLALRVGQDRDDAAEMARTLAWERRGWPDFEMYHAIFLAAPDVPVFGAEVPRDHARAAVRDGAAAVMGDAAALFGIDSALPPEDQAAREAGQAAAHCDALPPDFLPGMVEAQRLRDAAIARAVIAAWAETGGPVAVITGNGHARRDWGAPALLGDARPELRLLSVGQFESPPEPPVPFDVWTTAPAPERDDPCAALIGE